MTFSPSLIGGSVLALTLISLYPRLIYKPAFMDSSYKSVYFDCMSLKMWAERQVSA
jgi:hypothetical protein